jgi:hypothetical protein
MVLITIVYLVYHGCFDSSEAPLASLIPRCCGFTGAFLVALKWKKHENCWWNSQKVNIGSEISEFSPCLNCLNDDISGYIPSHNNVFPWKIPQLRFCAASHYSLGNSRYGDNIWLNNNSPLPWNKVIHFGKIPLLVFIYTDMVMTALRSGQTKWNAHW